MLNDPVDAVIAAFLDHLKDGAPEPSLEHLTEDERSEANEVIDLIKEVRGIDFLRIRPSLETLLDTESMTGLAPEPRTRMRRPTQRKDRE